LQLAREQLRYVVDDFSKSSDATDEVFSAASASGILPLHQTVDANVTAQKLFLTVQVKIFTVNVWPGLI
jgi:hypothetical protein